MKKSNFSQTIASIDDSEEEKNVYLIMMFAFQIIRRKFSHPCLCQTPGEALGMWGKQDRQDLFHALTSPCPPNHWFPF